MRIGALTLALVLSACGFHFAGSRPLPAELATVFIDVITPYSVAEPPLESALRGMLQRRGARITGTVTVGTTVVRLSELSESRQVLSLGPDGKALEYRLVTSVNYAIFRDAQPLLAPGSLRVMRDYSYNAEQVLAKEAEEERLREFIQAELAELLMLRVEASLGAARAAKDSGPTVTSGAAPE